MQKSADACWDIGWRPRLNLKLIETKLKLNSVKLKSLKRVNKNGAKKDEKASPFGRKVFLYFRQCFTKTINPIIFVITIYFLNYRYKLYTISVKCLVVYAEFYDCTLTMRPQSKSWCSMNCYWKPFQALSPSVFLTIYPFQIQQLTKNSSHIWSHSSMSFLLNFFFLDQKQKMLFCLRKHFKLL